MLGAQWSAQVNCLILALLLASELLLEALQQRAGRPKVFSGELDFTPGLELIQQSQRWPEAESLQQHVGRRWSAQVSC